jgi:hypothetical protein
MGACSNCHATVAEAARFCGACGSPVDAPGATAMLDGPASETQPMKVPAPSASGELEAVSAAGAAAMAASDRRGDGATGATGAIGAAARAWRRPLSEALGAALMAALGLGAGYLIWHRPAVSPVGAVAASDALAPPTVTDDDDVPPPEIHPSSRRFQRPGRGAAVGEHPPVAGREPADPSGSAGSASTPATATVDDPGVHRDDHSAAAQPAPPNPPSAPALAPAEGKAAAPTPGAAPANPDPDVAANMRAGGEEAVPLSAEELADRDRAEGYATDIRFVARTHRAEVRACYERAFKTESPRGARVEIGFTVDVEGIARLVHAVANTSGSDALATCLTQRVASWRFPHPPGGDYAAVYPFIFQQGQPGGR